MDNDRETTNNRDEYPSQTLYNFSRCPPKPSARRQTRHAASDVDFRVDRDLSRISENDNSRRKRATRPHHCPSCLSQSVHDNSMDSHLNGHHRRKNPEKLLASLTQHLNRTSSKVATSLRKNRSVQKQGNPMSPRASSAHQRARLHRPGTSRNRNNPGNAAVHRLPRKHGNIEPCECTRLDSPLRDIVNSDDASEDTDSRFPPEHLHSRNIYEQSDLYWHSPPGEPHSEPEMDSPPQNRRRDCAEPKKRHSGQGESVYENCREVEAKVLIETGSSVDRDVRQQCERDQQELKDLYKDVDAFAKGKSAGRIVGDSHDEDSALDRPKEQHEEMDEDSDSRDLLESINQLVAKIPLQRRRNGPRVATELSTKGSKGRCRDSKEHQSRVGSSKLDTRRPCVSVGMDGRSCADVQEQEELGRNFAEELDDVHPESLKREEEGTKEVESLSETEEEARELAREENETEEIRKLAKNLCPRKRSNFGKDEKRTTRDEEPDSEEKRREKVDCAKKQGRNTREPAKGKRAKDATIREESEPLRVNHDGRNDAERKDSKRTDGRVRSRGREEMADKMYEELKNCYGLFAAQGAAGDLELETSKTRTCIDEMIESGLSREAKRGSRAIRRDISKDLQCEADGSAGGPSKRVASDEPNKIRRPDNFSPVLRSDEQTRANRGDCFCKSLAKIVADYREPREYVRRLKDHRWVYLSNMQSDLEKLYGLEKYLDSCSPERRSSSRTFTTGFDPEANESKNIAEKRDRAKGSGIQSKV